MMPTVLFIGGMDSSGAAGLLRDCAVATEFGVNAKVAVTAVTAQTERAVNAVEYVSPNVVAAQIAAACETRIDAVKIGMLGTEEIVRSVARVLPDCPVVLDPVLQSTSGKCLLNAEGVEELLEVLLPRAYLLTPNRPELMDLGGRLGGIKEPQSIVGELMRRGAGAVLVKGGHDDTPDTAEDRLYHAGGVERFTSQRYPVSLRGTGCHLASAIASGLASGMTLSGSIGTAKDHLQQRFRRASRELVTRSDFRTVC